MLGLYIANKNYSSWSLRPWVLMRDLAIPFTEHALVFGDEPAWDAFRKISPSGKVPCLLDGPLVVWDSAAIVEYLAERHPAVWPAESTHRAWARSAVAEMHSGFGELRARCSMSCGVRVALRAGSEALQGDLARLDALWNEGLDRFGGPYLAGRDFTAVDAFFAPVAFRIQTYGLVLSEHARRYGERLLALPSMRDWYAGALAETARDAAHDAAIEAAGTVTSDLRPS